MTNTNVPIRKKANRPAHLTRTRPPAFIPVALRARRDGWSPVVQCTFLAALYVRGSVAAAARAVGRSRASAYKLRVRAGAESFKESWDRVLSGPMKRTRKGKRTDWRKLTLKELRYRAAVGLWRPVLYRGKMRAITIKPNNSALLRLIRRLDGGRAMKRIAAAKTQGQEFLKTPASLCQTQHAPDHDCIRGPSAKSARVMT